MKRLTEMFASGREELEQKQMGVAVTFAAIALTGAAFMGWFLVALLLDSTPSICWIVPIRCEPENENCETLIRSYVDDDHAAERELGDCHVEVLENDNHAEERASSLISIDVRNVSGSVGWRSIHPIHRAVFHHRL
jgi:hypothetical protein